MAISGAQPGNQNAARGKRFREAILRALARRAGNVDAGLDAAADKLVALAHDGDKWALEELANRVDGRVAQALIGGDDDDPPVKFARVVREIVDPKRDANPESSDG